MSSGAAQSGSHWGLWASHPKRGSNGAPEAGALFPLSAVTFLSLDCLALSHNPLSVNHESTCAGLMARAITKGCTLCTDLLCRAQREFWQGSNGTVGTCKQRAHHLGPIQRDLVHLVMANTTGFTRGEHASPYQCGCSDCKSSSRLARINVHVQPDCPPH